MLDYTTDPSGDITRIDQTTDGVTQEQRYVYDDLHRLTAVQDLAGAAIDRYTYDKTGNRLSHQAGSGSVVAYGYANAPTAVVYPGAPGYGNYSHRLQSVGATARTYDANGNTLSGVKSTVDLDFDATNRMEAAVDTAASGSARSYQYNGAGERVRKSDAGASTHTLTHYDLDGQVLEQSTWTSATPPVLIERSEAVWLDRTPVVLERTNVSSGTTTVRSANLATDHLNTPRLAREAVAGTVWRWNLVVGETLFGGSNEFGDRSASVAGSGPMRLDMRLPGQLFDQETGMHYNYYRNYEAISGRYVESDPFGLVAGTHAYGYANLRPTSVSDRLGLYAEGMQLKYGLDRLGRAGEPYIPACFLPDRCNTSAGDCIKNCREFLMPGAPTSPFGLLAEGAGAGSAISGAAGGGFWPAVTGLNGAAWAGWNAGCVLSCASPCNYPNSK